LFRPVVLVGERMKMSWGVHITPTFLRFGIYVDILCIQKEKICHV